MSGSQLVLSQTQLSTLNTYVKQLGQNQGVRFVILADMGGQDIVYYDGGGNSDIASIAALAAGDLMATLEIGRMLGGERACNLIIQEHDVQTVLISRVGQALFLLISTMKDVPLGWSRLSIKRTAESILSVVGSLADTPPPPGISSDFEDNFAEQINAIW